MITAAEARKGTKIEANEEYNKMIYYVEKSIKEAMERGETSCHFDMQDEYLRPWQLEVKAEFAKRGFTFRPRGYIGGVLQRTQQICW